MSYLFAVYLGGKAKGAMIEVHDVALVAGKSIEDTVPQLRQNWFGNPASLHVDSWVRLSYVDGYKVVLSRKPLPSPGPSLYFLNVGSYTAQRFGENHQFFFLVAESAPQAKARAKKTVKATGDQLVHLDNTVKVDSVTRIDQVNGFYIQLKKSARAVIDPITNIYWPIG